LAALELDSILFITSQVHNCNSLQCNLQFLGNCKGWFTKWMLLDRFTPARLPEAGDLSRRTCMAKKRQIVWSSFFFYNSINAIKRMALVKTNYQRTCKGGFSFLKGVENFLVGCKQHHWASFGRG
jgi:hypothetical protein